MAHEFDLEPFDTPPSPKQCCVRCWRFPNTATNFIEGCRNPACECHKSPHTTMDVEEIVGDFEKARKAIETIMFYRDSLPQEGRLLDILTQFKHQVIKEEQERIMERLERMIWAHEGDTGAAPIRRKIHNDTIREVAKMISTTTNSQKEI